MNKKELEARKKALLKELGKEKNNKKNAEHKLSLYEYKEKQQAKLSKPKIAEDQKHTIVSVYEFENDYNYDKRREEWHKKAGHNDAQLVCGKCKDDDNWETILLDDGRHICYYCWIKKPTTKKNKTKSSSAKNTKVKKIVSTQTNKEVMKQLNKSNEIQIVPVEIYENYDLKNRFSQWEENLYIATKPVTCDICKAKENEEVIVLDDGRHICYYCWISEPTTTKKVETKFSKKENINEKDNVAVQQDNSAPGKLFWIISIVSGLLLIGLIVVLALGIISGNFDFNFNN